jgi:hypothetical protein
MAAMDLLTYPGEVPGLSLTESRVVVIDTIVIEKLVDMPPQIAESPGGKKHAC